MQRVYGRLSIDVVSTGWLGILPMVLAASALRRHANTLSGDRRSGLVRQWALIGAVFFVWALGPHLMAFGINTGMILPQAFLRYVPVAANARIPGRAIVVSYLALSILAAVAATEWCGESRRGRVARLAIAIVLIGEYLPAPFPLVAMDTPAIYETLRDRVEPGAVCEVPLGIRHGFGALSERQNAIEAVRPLPDRQLAGDSLLRNGIKVVVLNRSTASAALVEYVENVLPLRLIAREGEHSLYLVLL